MAISALRSTRARSQSGVDSQSGQLPQLDPQTVLKIEDLHTYFHTDSGVVRAVNGVSLEVGRQKVLGVVGESGCGKSITALSVMQLVPIPRGKIESGRILFNSPSKGVIDIAQLDPRGNEMRSIRGNEISMIFQEPMTSLNPVLTVGYQIVESLIYHQDISKQEAWEIAVEMLAKVGIPSPEQRAKEYPHQMSGGMRQRAMIAIALCCNPVLLIADEPTTALDVTIQAQILDLMKKIQEEYERMAIIMITHNLGVVGRMCDDVAVMYMGKVIEQSDVRTIFRNAAHPYTIGLLNSVPRLGARRKRLVPIKGVVPDPTQMPEGCSFAPRCPHAHDRCKEEPPVIEVEPGHTVSCWLHA